MTFKFSNIVDTYDEHVNAHIPNYNKVIDKTIKLCKLYQPNSPILDFGSANGKTLKKLYNEGFRNLHGVEPVQEMVEASDKKIARYYTSFPDLNFDVIVANWVLHFIEDKKSILERFYKNLNDNGIIIISEKISQNEIVKKFYYDFKTENGVSNKDIREKEKGLKGVMYLYSLNQYLSTINTIGFSTIEVIDGDWGFVTLMVQK